ncbi:FtsB family cell division protein [Moraxella nasicaprae]|uniref:Cell division protein FtsB n=1 Tax=Moraxella nasicaprae TaxID=2904122 RepID=A0ABY6F5I4_9GAMM|nr:septum formation initiator family protein [Moraxella nasicaprae]UXZ05338.1 septum formation initiator family protein [Moraxella nasicaprae]
MANTVIRELKTNKGYLVAIIVATVVLVLLQRQYWYGEYGHANLEKLQLAVDKQQKLNEEQSYANDILVADIYDLKSGLSAIEEHARLDLGLIKSGEVFIQLSNAPIVYSRQLPETVEETVESVDFVPE